MDVVALGLAKADAAKKYSQREPRPYAAIEKMQRGQEDVVIGVGGDSTGVGSTRWAYLLAGLLGALYPAYRVLHYQWADATGTLGTGALGAPNVIQAGRAANTITDTFTRADSSTIGSAETGQPWTTVTNMAIASNKLVASGTAGAFMDVGSPAFTWTMDVVLPTAGFLRLFPKYLSGADHLYLEIIPGASNGTLNLVKRINSVASTVATSAAVAGISNGAAISVSMTVTASTFSITIGGTTLTYNLLLGEADTFGAITQIQIAAVLTSGTASFDNLSITLPAPLLKVYNGSLTGQNCDYTRVRLLGMIPEQADLLFINHGHNEVGVNAAPQYLALARTMLDLYPRAQLVAISQNPRAVTNSGYVAGRERNTSIARLAAREGWGYVNVYQTFIDYGDYATDLLNGDGLHPSDAAGSPLWAATVLAHLQAKTKYPVRPRADRARIFVPPAQFVINESTPVLGVFNSTAQSWAFDPTTQQSVMAAVDVPASWYRFNIYLLMTTVANSGLTGSTNGSSWDVGYTSASDPTMVHQGNQVLTTAAAVGSIPNIPALTVVTNSQGFNNAPQPGAEYVLKALTGGSAAGRPLELLVRRRAADAGDTYANAVHFLGAVIERAN